MGGWVGTRPREKKPALKKGLNLVESFKLSWWLCRGQKQLSRLEKATFEACLGLFGQNMKTWVATREGVACGNRAAV